MKKRIRNKKYKQTKIWVMNNYDYFDGNFNYHTIPVKCHSCMYYESGDESVGLAKNCACPQVYNQNEDIIPKVEDRILKIMKETLGYSCPFFRNKLKIMKNGKVNII